MKNQIAEKIRQYKLIAIARGIDAEHIIPAAQALLDGGIVFIEVTFDHAAEDYLNRTAKIIKLLADHFKNQMYIGAGTVLSSEEVRAAFLAGAKYIVSPDLNEETVRATLELGMVSIPGAMTPSEIQRANSLGADFVKVFPAGDLGCGYLKSILSPLKHIETLVVGGVDDENLMQFINAGAKGAGIGSNLVRKDLILQGRYRELTSLALKYSSQASYEELNK